MKTVVLGCRPYMNNAFRMFALEKMKSLFISPSKSTGEVMFLS